MTELEYKILSAISLAGTVQWSAVVNMFLADHAPVTLDAHLRVLLDRNWICRTGGSSEPPICYIRLDSAGILALETEKSIRAENIRAKQEQEIEHSKQVIADKIERRAEKRADRISQILFAFLNTLLSILAGIVIEYHASVIELIKHFFEQ